MAHACCRTPLVSSRSLPMVSVTKLQLHYQAGCPGANLHGPRESSVF